MQVEVNAEIKGKTYAINAYINSQDDTQIQILNVRIQSTQSGKLKGEFKTVQFFEGVAWWTFGVSFETAAKFAVRDAFTQDKITK
jgi:hypothetical protein